MTGAAVPDALDALVATFTSALPAFDVTDGQPVDPGPSVLCVGWDGIDQAAVSGLVTVGNVGGGGQHQEVFDVSSLLSTWSGTASPSAERTEVFAAFATVKATLRDDQTLGGAVSSARLTAFDYMTSNPVEGVPERIRFTVHIEAWR